MLLTFNGVRRVFYTVILLVAVQSSHQYTYPCNSSAACGCSSKPASLSRIVGGESAGTNTWEWAVSIFIRNSSLCGGAILSSSWIITAAHCTVNTSATQLIVYAGSNSRFSGQSRVASRVINHPGYNDDTYENDISLIQLSTPLTMTSAVKTICLPSVSAPTLAAGEWPSANLKVCYGNIFLLCSEINS